VADWATISALATGGGTLALAAATFASVRSANRSARLAELALQEQRRPVLVHSREDDHVETVPFVGRQVTRVPGGGAVVEAEEEAVFLALSLRNVGAGIAVLQAWYSDGSLLTGNDLTADVADFKPLIRDQYIASGDVGIWQGAVRDPGDPLHALLTKDASDHAAFTVDLLYTDQVGGQRTISRFGVLPGEDGGWSVAAARHWYLDAPAPRLGGN
jgi:hypothetical protein